LQETAAFNPVAKFRSRRRTRPLRFI